MTTATYGAELAVATEAKPARKNWFHRFIAALQESRMKQAQREIEYYRHLLPREMEWAGTKISYKNEDQLPFVR
jgi:hypothetical protein